MYASQRPIELSCLRKYSIDRYTVDVEIYIYLEHIYIHNYTHMFDSVCKRLTSSIKTEALEAVVCC